MKEKAPESACLQFCVCAYVCACLLCVHARAMCVSVCCVRACVCTCMHACVCVCMHACMHARGCWWLGSWVTLRVFAFACERVGVCALM